MNFNNLYGLLNQFGYNPPPRRMSGGGGFSYGSGPLDGGPIPGGTFPYTRPQLPGTGEMNFGQFGSGNMWPTQAGSALTNFGGTPYGGTQGLGGTGFGSGPKFGGGGFPGILSGGFNRRNNRGGF